eukprot:gnl/Dysnectes_brevis/293_a326_1561.p2 GENE.gnl/Dysnectes_brevis/293_a326_1561~~gnl/Dysnectes_brevis/293_a326_1561.p2  ORF type:complete len:226 (+),score=43.18 gnl/Dysnectes_brevis/293_a326_1561:1596-2273(+)
MGHRGSRVDLRSGLLPPQSLLMGGVVRVALDNTTLSDNTTVSRTWDDDYLWCSFSAYAPPRSDAPNRCRLACALAALQEDTTAAQSRRDALGMFLSFLPARETGLFDPQPEESDFSDTLSGDCESEANCPEGTCICDEELDKRVTTPDFRTLNVRALADALRAQRFPDTYEIRDRLPGLVGSDGMTPAALAVQLGSTAAEVVLAATFLLRDGVLEVREDRLCLCS